jgi:hypothetical protein
MEDIKILSKEELESRLAELRQKRKTGYLPPKKKVSAKVSIKGFEGIDDNLAAKILADLEAMNKEES